jgi:hypothetical protein
MENPADAASHLSRIQGPGELHAALLALLLPEGSQRAGRAWEIETEGQAGAAPILEAVRALPVAARLPWFETLLDRMLAQPLPVRQALMEATRRVMSARGLARPIDRLHYLAMRQKLGTRPAFAARTGASEAVDLDDATVLAIATFAAHVARMVPGGDEANSLAWFDAVTAPWKVRHLIGPLSAPSADELVPALQAMQAIGWMLRPVLVRDWVDAAIELSAHRKLGDEAADALRLCCLLLDTPRPPALERHFTSAPGFPA